MCLLVTVALIMVLPSSGVVLHVCSSLSAFQVCLHMFSLDFLNQVANGLEKDSMLLSLSLSLSLSHFVDTILAWLNSLSFP